MTKFWLDDVRPAPEGYIWVETVSAAIHDILICEREIDLAWARYIQGEIDFVRALQIIQLYQISEISCDNDLGDGIPEGYKLLDWLEATDREYPIHIHTSNPVAAERMRQIIKRNDWAEVR